MIVKVRIPCIAMVFNGQPYYSAVGQGVRGVHCGEMSAAAEDIHVPAGASVAMVWIEASIDVPETNVVEGVVASGGDGLDQPMEDR